MKRQKRLAFGWMKDHSWVLLQWSNERVSMKWRKPPHWLIKPQGCLVNPSCSLGKQLSKELAGKTSRQGKTAASLPGSLSHSFSIILSEWLFLPLSWSGPFPFNEGFLQVSILPSKKKIWIWRSLRQWNELNNPYRVIWKQNWISWSKSLIWTP